MSTSFCQILKYKGCKDKIKQFFENLSVYFVPLFFFILRWSTGVKERHIQDRFKYLWKCLAKIVTGLK